MRTSVSAFLCPSDTGPSKFGEAARFNANNQMTLTNYRGSRGDLAGGDFANAGDTNTDRDFYGAEPVNTNGTPMLESPFYQTTHHRNMPRSWLRTGAFVGGFEIVTSGTSNSVAFSEGIIGINTSPVGADVTENTGGRYREVLARGVTGRYNVAPQGCLNLKGSHGEFSLVTQQVQPSNHWMGRRAYGNYPGAVQFYTLLPPNNPSCAGNWVAAWVSASSFHAGGVNASFLDGTVRFVSNAINTQNLNRSVSGHGDQNPEQPIDAAGGFSYGVWAELGAINSAHSVSL